ncbi:hypothetical protein [Streptomyces sp. M1013]|nr:hypothetical protein [Streptomyces sp. M1013]
MPIAGRAPPFAILALMAAGAALGLRPSATYGGTSQSARRPPTGWTSRT